VRKRDEVYEKTTRHRPDGDRDVVDNLPFNVRRDHHNVAGVRQIGPNSDPSTRAAEIMRRLKT
jgi:hypothetical protein